MIERERERESAAVINTYHIKTALLRCEMERSVVPIGDRTHLRALQSTAGE